MLQPATATVEHHVSPGGSGTVHSIDFARRRRSRGGDSRDVIRVLLVGGHAITRAGLRRLLEEDSGLRVVGEATTGREGARLIRSTAADVVLLDSGHVDAHPATRTRMLGGRVPVLLLTECDGDDQLLAALRAGATGVLRKDSHPADLAFAVRTVADGGALLPPRTARRLIRELADKPYPTSR